MNPARFDPKQPKQKHTRCTLPLWNLSVDLYGPSKLPSFLSWVYTYIVILFFKQREVTYFFFKTVEKLFSCTNKYSDCLVIHPRWGENKAQCVCFWSRIISDQAIVFLTKINGVNLLKQTKTFTICWASLSDTTARRHSASHTNIYPGGENSCRCETINTNSVV